MSQYSVKRIYINSPKNQKKINNPIIYFLETAPPLCGKPYHIIIHNTQTTN